MQELCCVLIKKYFLEKEEDRLRISEFEVNLRNTLMNAMLEKERSGSVRKRLAENVVMMMSGKEDEELVKLCCRL